MDSLSLSAVVAFAFLDQVQWHFRFCMDCACLATWAVVLLTLVSSSVIFHFSAPIFLFGLDGISGILDGLDRTEREGREADVDCGEI